MLDPADWERFRAHAHRAVDDMIDMLAEIREAPAWEPMPDDVRAHFHAPLPTEPRDLGEVYAEFTRDILPYHSGNIHPRFFGWVQGTGTPSGALADFLAAAMNPNAGGRDHAAVAVERQVIAWCRELFGFPPEASGLIVSGTSMANLVAVLVARTSALGTSVRADGVDSARGRLVGYASASTHSCVQRAFEVAGLGSTALRHIACDASDRMDLAELRAALARDREAGDIPFLVVGNAGTVGTGAIDPLDALADFAAREKLWFHIDGAFGALAILAPSLRARLRGIERADSLAFDFHKWLHVPYDAGFILVRDGALHRATFASEEAYLKRRERGLAAGTPWLTDFGIELSRGFHALKVWFTIQEHGTRKLGAAIERNVAQAVYLAERIAEAADFELLARVALNVVCFRYVAAGMDDAELDRFNDDLVVALQESGIAVASTTSVRGRRAIRVCIVNHRAEERDLDLLLAALRSLANDALPL